MDSPIPPEWMEEGGCPPEAEMAYIEGACPRHLTPLKQDTVTVGGKGTGWYASKHEIPAGWCDQCQAWWHRPYGRAAELIGLMGACGLGATWDTSER